MRAAWPRAPDAPPRDRPRCACAHSRTWPRAPPTGPPGALPRARPTARLLGGGPCSSCRARHAGRRAGSCAKRRPRAAAPVRRWPVSAQHDGVDRVPQKRAQVRERGRVRRELRHARVVTSALLAGTRRSTRRRPLPGILSEVEGARASDPARRRAAGRGREDLREGGPLGVELRAHERSVTRQVDVFRRERRGADTETCRTPTDPAVPMNSSPASEARRFRSE